MFGRTRVSWVKAAFSALLLAFWCMFGALSMLFAKAFRLRFIDSLPLLFHGFVCRLFSLQCEFVGVPRSDEHTLYVSNHVSYLDVFILGSVLRGSFVAKSEVASWPIFGNLATLQDTLFLERSAHRAAEQIERVSNHLHQKGSLIMFPEGTSTDGTHVAPFRSSLFAAASNVSVQPVTIAYVDYDGEPMTRDERERYAWYLPNPEKRPGIPNRPFASHFFAALGLRRCTVKVRFHEPVAEPLGNRKACALQCESTVRRGLEQFLSNRPDNIESSKLAAPT